MMYRSAVLSFVLAVSAMFWPQPASAADPIGVFQGIDASTAIASGSATDADRPGQSIAVDFWLGTGLTDYVGGAMTQASDGSFTFQIPSQYRDGVSRTFCAWAINDTEPHVQLGCKAFAQTNHPPTGALTSFDASTGVASGSAIDPDRPGQSILVDFFLGTDFTTYLGQATTVASSGAFSFQVPAQYLDGQTHTICAWAINEVAPHTQIGCKTVADSPATGSLSVIAASNYMASGTASDPDDTAASIKVELRVGASPVASVQTSNGAFQIQIPEQYRDGLAREFCAFAFSSRPFAAAANIGCKVYQNRLPTGSMKAFDANASTQGSVSDPDSPGAEVEVHFYAGRTFANYLGKARTTGGSFGFRIPGDKRVSDEVCGYAINLQGGTNPLLGCSNYVKPGLQYFGYFTSSTPFRLGKGDHTEAVTDHANLAWVESNDCQVIVNTEDRRYCDAQRDQPSYRETLPSTGRTVDFYDLVARVRTAAQFGDKAVIHLEQFLFAFDSVDECIYLMTDADDLIEAVSRQLKKHEWNDRPLMDTVEVVYPMDEPYLKAVVQPSDPVRQPEPGETKGICDVPQGKPISTFGARAAKIYQDLSRVLASIRADDSLSGEPRFPGKKTAAIFSFEELRWDDHVGVNIPAEYDWVAYDGYIATNEPNQDYSNSDNYLGILQRKLAVLPNAASKRIFLVPEAYVGTAAEHYPKTQCTETTFIPTPNDDQRGPECVLLSNFMRAYRRALCDPSIVAIIPFLWQDGISKTVPLEDTANRYRDLTNYLALAMRVGEGISAANSSDGLYALPDVSCAAVMQPMQTATTTMYASASQDPQVADKRVPSSNATTSRRAWGSLALALLFGFGVFRLGWFRAKGN